MTSTCTMSSCDAATSKLFNATQERLLQVQLAAKTHQPLPYGHRQMRWYAKRLATVCHWWRQMWCWQKLRRQRLRALSASWHAETWLHSPAAAAVVTLFRLAFPCLRPSNGV